MFLHGLNNREGKLLSLNKAKKEGCPRGVMDLGFELKPSAFLELKRASLRICRCSH